MEARAKAEATVAAELDAKVAQILTTAEGASALSAAAFCPAVPPEGSAAATLFLVLDMQGRDGCVA